LSRDTVTAALSQRLRDDCASTWQGLLDHPFVQEIAAGTLPLEKFRFYIEQDILFLDDYVRSLGYAVGRAQDEEQLAALTRQIATVVDTEIDKERDLLRRVERLLGAGPRRATPAPTTLAYQSFLVSAAVRGDALDVLTSLLPCAWSYGEIGRRYLGETAEHPVYTDWMRLFGGREYLDYVDARIESFDRYAGRAHPARYARLTQLFTTAARLEQAFWDMGYQKGAR
jgi:thiaminase (transcriptional activator TenA)